MHLPAIKVWVWVYLCCNPNHEYLPKLKKAPFKNFLEHSPDPAPSLFKSQHFGGRPLLENYWKFKRFMVHANAILQWNESVGAPSEDISSIEKSLPPKSMILILVQACRDQLKLVSICPLRTHFPTERYTVFYHRSPQLPASLCWTIYDIKPFNPPYLTAF